MRDHDKRFLEHAEIEAKMSTCLRRQVGCVMVDEQHKILSTGYNGVAAGMPHCNELTGFNFEYKNGVDISKPLTGQPCERIQVYGNACSGANAPSGTNLEGCEAIHAEQNAVMQCSDVRMIHTCYVTHSPCLHCVKLLMNTGCQRVVFAHRYAHDEPARALWVRSRGLVCNHDLDTWQEVNL